MQHLEVSCAARRIYTSLGAEGLIYAYVFHVTLPLWFPVHKYKQNCQPVLFNFMFLLNKQNTL